MVGFTFFPGVPFTHNFCRIHHGELDDVIPISQSVQMEKALLRAGVTDVQFTRYPDAAHDSWTPAYGNIEVFQWMLSKRRMTRGEEVVVPEENKVKVV
jgi:acetyl esterase/lipase